MSALATVRVPKTRRMTTHQRFKKCRQKLVVQLMGGLEIVAVSEDDECFYDTLAEENDTIQIVNKGVWQIGKMGTVFSFFPNVETVDFLKDVTYAYRYSKKGVKRWASVLFVCSAKEQRKLTSAEEWSIVRNSFTHGRESIDWGVFEKTNNMQINDLCPILPWSLWLKHLASKRIKSS